MDSLYGNTGKLAMYVPKQVMRGGHVGRLLNLLQSFCFYDIVNLIDYYLSVKKAGKRGLYDL